MATKWMTPTLLAAFVNIIHAIPYPQADSKIINTAGIHTINKQIWQT
jgi:hypothetical protein